MFTPPLAILRTLPLKVHLIYSVMHWRRRIFWIVTGLIVLVAVVMASKARYEPSYDGKALSEWLELSRDSENPDERRRAQAARFPEIVCDPDGRRRSAAHDCLEPSHDTPLQDIECATAVPLGGLQTGPKDCQPENVIILGLAPSLHKRDSASYAQM